MKKHDVHVDLETLHELPLFPPRRRLWDWLAYFGVGELLLKCGYSPKPTPREEWLIKSVYLRAGFQKHNALITALGAAARVPSGNAPGSKAVN